MYFFSRLFLVYFWPCYYMLLLFHFFLVFSHKYFGIGAKLHYLTGGLYSNNIL